MREIYRANITPDYFQIGLFDQESPDAIPNRETGREAYVLGPKGILVSTGEADGLPQSVEIVVYEGTGIIDDFFLVNTILEIGNEGLFVGDPIEPDPPIPWPSGKTSVLVYVNAAPDEFQQNINLVTFVIAHMA